MLSSKKFRFGFIANSTEIASMFSNCIDPHSEEVTIRFASMEAAIPIAEELLQDGMEVILGSDGTGSLLMQTLGQPIISIARTHLDILNALFKAKEYGRFIGLTIFGAPIKGIVLFDELLSIKTRQVVFSTRAQLVKGITDAVEEGIDCLVGAGHSEHIVSSLGGNFVRVPLQRDMILRALREARAVALARRKEKQNEEEMRTILQIIKEGLIVVDSEGMVKICNQMAADILGLDLQQTIDHPLPEFIKETGLLNVLKRGETEIDQIRRVRGEYIVVNSSPIKIENKTGGVVSTFKEASRIHNIDLMIKEKAYPNGFVAKYNVEHITGASPNIRRVVEKARKYAETDLSILIQGESGTGKELLAQTIHNLGCRKKFPFIAINCSALTESLLESELFGYEEGSFTGAKKGGKLGLFELGHQGTIFLDEIADISQNTQAKLLRVIEEKKVRRIGGDRLIHVDVRIISSTWKDLLEEMELVRFRRDLYFRLARLKLTIPPLRERLDDISDILRNLLQKYGKGANVITPAMIERMRNYSWPGNIRELSSLIESYLILLGNSSVDEELFHELFEDLCQNGASAPAAAVRGDNGFSPPGGTLRDQLEEHERAIIHETLRKFQFKRKETARYLGISVNTLWRKLNSRCSVS